MGTPTPTGQPSRTQLEFLVEKYKKEAEKTHRVRRPKSGVALSTLGVAIFLATLYLDATGSDIHLWLWSGVGFLFLIFGYYVRDPNKALAFGGFVVNGVGGIAAIVLRVGQRKTDPVVVVPVVKDTPSREFVSPRAPKRDEEEPMESDTMEMPPRPRGAPRPEDG